MVVLIWTEDPQITEHERRHSGGEHQPGSGHHPPVPGHRTDDAGVQTRNWISSLDREISSKL